jgi:hypothetical protein
VTDAERREAWEAATVSKLSETPLEWIQMSILFENVSRAFTHQLVRTRMATYAQESMRFAVKDNVQDAVKLPPSLAGTIPDSDFRAQCTAAGIWAEGNRSREQRWRMRWDRALTAAAQAYDRERQRRHARRGRARDAADEHPNAGPRADRHEVAAPSGRNAALHAGAVRMARGLRRGGAGSPNLVPEYTRGSWQYE